MTWCETANLGNVSRVTDDESLSIRVLERTTRNEVGCLQWNGTLRVPKRSFAFAAHAVRADREIVTTPRKAQKIMRTFENVCAQGDTYFRRVSGIPNGTTEAAREKDGSLVVAHSETGAHHSFPEGSQVELRATANPFVCYLRVESPSMLEHHRPHDTHEAILFSPGCYEIRRQRERAYTPEGWRNRMVQD